MRQEKIRIHLQKAGQMRFEVTREGLTEQVIKAEHAAGIHGTDLSGKMTHMPSNANLSYLEGAAGMAIIEEHQKKQGRS